MSAGVVEVPFVGRTRQLQIPQAALRRVEQGETAAVFVTGESGVGKTRFLTAATEGLPEGTVVLAGRCRNIAQAPLYPLRGALRGFLEEPVPDGSESRDAARQLIALLAGGLGPADAAGNWLERICTGLGKVSNGQLLVLSLDDLHWVDPLTRDLLVHLLAVPVGLRLLVLAAVRTQHLVGGHPIQLLLSEWRRHPSVEVVDLKPLAKGETERLAEEVVDRRLAPGEVAALWERSRGNPFVTLRLAQGLRDGQAGLPESLRNIALAAVDALPQDAQAVVRALAAGVEPVRHDLLQRVVDLDPEALIAGLRAAVDHLIVEDDSDGSRFRQGLYREALAARFLVSERIRLHRRYAEAIERAPGDDGAQALLAHHWRWAEEPQRAVTAAVAAAEEAERRYGFADGFAHWIAALDVIEEAPPGRLTGVDRAEVLRRAADAAHRSGEHERAVALVGKLAGELAHGSTGRLPCWLHTSRATYLAALGRLTEAEAEYDRAWIGGGAGAERARAGARSAELLVQLGRYAEAAQRARAALELARRADDPSSVVLASVVLGFTQAALDDPVAGRETVEGALRTAESNGLPEDVTCAYLHLAMLLTGPLNELEAGVALARTGAARADALGLGRTDGARLLAAAAGGLWRVGRWAECEQVIAEGLTRRPSGTEAAELLLARSRLSLGYGDLDAAERDLDAVATLVAGGGGARYVLPLQSMRAGLAMWRRDHAAARAAVREGLELFQDRSDDLVIMAVLVWHGLRAEAEAKAAGRRAKVDRSAVQALLSALDRIVQATGASAGPVGAMVTGYRGLCDGERSRIEGSPDPGLWARAAQMWQQRRQPYPAAYARLRQADAGFRQRMRNAEAEAALREGYRDARLLRARPLMREMEELARHARRTLDEPEPEPEPAPAAPRPPDAPDDAPAGELARLTDREREVLALVAEGHTNQEVGDRLYISRSTVGVHMTHILDKLQIHSRVQATAIYLRATGRA